MALLWVVLPNRGIDLAELKAIVVVVGLMIGLEPRPADYELSSGPTAVAALLQHRTLTNFRLHGREFSPFHSSPGFEFY